MWDLQTRIVQSPKLIIQQELVNVEEDKADQEKYEETDDDNGNRVTTKNSSEDKE